MLAPIVLLRRALDTKYPAGDGFKRRIRIARDEKGIRAKGKISPMLWHGRSDRVIGFLPHLEFIVADIGDPIRLCGDLALRFDWR